MGRGASLSELRAECSQSMVMDTPARRYIYCNRKHEDLGGVLLSLSLNQRGSKEVLRASAKSEYKSRLEAEPQEAVPMKSTKRESEPKSGE